MKRLPRPLHSGDTAGIALYRYLRRRRYMIAWVILTAVLSVALTVAFANLEFPQRLVLALVGASINSGLITYYFYDVKWRDPYPLGAFVGYLVLPLFLTGLLVRASL